jgi:hypothetical protein
MKNILKIVLSILTIILSIICIFTIKGLNMLPNKYFIIFVSIMILFNLIVLLLYTKKKWLNIIGLVISIITIIVSIIGYYYGSETIDYLKHSFNNDSVEISEYGLYVLKKNNFELNRIKNFGYLNDEFAEKAVKELKSRTNAEELSYDDMYTLSNDLKDNKINSMLLDKTYYNMLLDENEISEDDVKLIHSFNIEIKKKVTKQNVDTLKPFNIFLSGSDARSNYIASKTRSDVNMIISVDPKKKTILLTSIPRDYYVSVYGKTGLKDKLTHAGIYGIDTSVKTVENLFDINIDYYIKVGFSSVIEVVNLIGGIDIESDKAFVSHCGDGGAIKTNVKKGMNHFNGGEALSYARERYAYALGDRHRILNQQQVLEAVINKVTTDKSVLLKYDKLLKSLRKLYKTNIPSELISLLVKNQLEDMSGYKIERQSVSGSDASMNTYTAPSKKRYVMIPYEKDVKKASENIKKYA